VKDENGALLADSHNILNRWKNYFSQLLNVHRVSGVRQVEIHTAEPLIPDLSLFEVEIAIANLKRYKSPDSLILYGIRKNCLISGRSLLLYQFTTGAIKLTVVIIMGHHCYKLHFIQYPSLRVKSISRRNYWANISVDFDITDQLLIRYLAFVRYCRKNGST
jgi:hypothetical protein